MKSSIPPQLTLTEIKQLHDCIPSGEGSVYMKLFHDGSWGIDVEYQTVVIASFSCDYMSLVDYSYRIREMNHAWELACRGIVERISAVWEEIKKTTFRVDHSE